MNSPVASASVTAPWALTFSYARAIDPAAGPADLGGEGRQPARSPNGRCSTVRSATAPPAAASIAPTWKRTSGDHPRPVAAVLFATRGDALVAVCPAHRRHRHSADGPWGDTGADAPALGWCDSVLKRADEPPPPHPRHLRTCGRRRSGANRIGPRRAELLGPREGHPSIDICEERLGRNIFRDGCRDAELPFAIGERIDRLIARLRTMDGGTVTSRCSRMANLVRCSAPDGSGCRCSRPSISRSAPRR